ATLMNAVKCLISKLIMGFTLELLLKKWAMHKRHDFVAKKHFQSIRFIAILDKYPHSYRTVSGFSRRMCHVSVQRKSAERSDGSTSRPLSAPSVQYHPDFWQSRFHGAAVVP